MLLWPGPNLLCAARPKSIPRFLESKQPGQICPSCSWRRGDESCRPLCLAQESGRQIRARRPRTGSTLPAPWGPVPRQRPRPLALSMASRFAASRADCESSDTANCRPSTSCTCSIFPVAARPAMLGGLLGISFAQFVGLQFVQQRAKVEPGQLCSSLLHKLPARPSLGKRAHVLEVARRKPSCPETSPADRVRAGLSPGLPIPSVLPLEDVTSDLPIKRHEFPVTERTAHWRACSTRVFNPASQAV